MVAARRHWIKNNLRLRLPHKASAPALNHCPHKKGVVIKSFDTTPRKPNSAKRKTAKVRLSNRRYIRVYFEGMGLNRLQPHSVVLVRGRGPRDLPGVRYTAVRGQYDLPALLNYRNARSKYGVKVPVKEKEERKKKIQFSTLTVRNQMKGDQAFLRQQRQRFLVYKHLKSFKRQYKKRQFFLLKATPI